MQMAQAQSPRHLKQHVGSRHSPLLAALPVRLRKSQPCVQWRQTQWDTNSFSMYLDGSGDWSYLKACVPSV